MAKYKLNQNYGRFKKDAQIEGDEVNQAGVILVKFKQGDGSYGLIPLTYLQKVEETIADFQESAVKETGYKTKSVFGLVGLAGGLYLAHKKKKGVWGYVGFAFLGLIAGNIIGAQVSKVINK